jgi:hypothetical protein
MICSVCGTPLAQDARFCPKCGAPVAFQPPPPGYPGYAAPGYFVPYTRVARNLQPLGMLWLVYAGFRLISGLFGLMFLHGFFGHQWHSSLDFGWTPFGNDWMAGLWPMIFLSVLLKVGYAVLTGYALLTRQPWGRILGIIFGILALIHFPLGTALGIYTLWVLAPSASGDEYTAMTYKAPRS